MSLSPTTSTIPGGALGRTPTPGPRILPAPGTMRLNASTNPGLEANLTDWFIHSNIAAALTARSQVWTARPQSLWSGRVVGTALAAGDFIGSIHANFAVNELDYWTASATVNTTPITSGNGWWMEIFYFDAAAVQLAQFNSNDLSTPTSRRAGVRRLSVGGQAPPTSATMQIAVVGRTNTPGDFLDLFWDDVLLERTNELRDTFDGDYPNAFFTGARFNSPSVLVT